MTAKVEKHEFQAEVNQVLSIVVNSLYSHKEIFLRELISNGSDALDKLAFRALTDHELLKEDQELRIDLIPSKDAGTLTIRDNGIGMSHDDLIDNLGTIARSGSKILMESLSGDAKKDLSLIGQFGVGFYSAFLVADKVTVTSLAAGEDKAWMWQSAAAGDFTVEECEKANRGTNVILHLKEDCKEFLDEFQVRSLVQKYSDYVRHPIRLQVERTKEIEGEGDEKEKDKKEKKTETIKEWEKVNTASALWTRPKSEVADEQYNEFYKHLTHQWDEPLARTHFKVEGLQEMTGLLFVPSHAPFDLFERKARGVRLYVKRVFIMEDCEELLPEWLRFMRGVVDSEDLPLNVSRELLQQETVTRSIRKQVVNKTLALLEELADEGETTKTEKQEDDDGKETEAEIKVNRYETFWQQFGKVLKEGVYYEPANRDQLSKLLRYESSRDEGLTSLQDYVDRMPEDQEAIYYLIAESIGTARHSPHIEALQKRGYEVLLMSDPVDEWVVQGLPTFADKKLISAAKGALDIPQTEADKKAKEQKQTEYSGLLDKVKGNLDEHVKEVRLSDRLTDSPSCLVGDDHSISPYLQKVLRASGQDVPEQKRILELNPDHPVVQRLQAMAEDKAKGDEVADWSQLLFDQALVAEGNLPSDPAQFAKSVTKLMQKAVE
ncbi:MAG: molecular chaperone HtpG [Planctomycetota bacterium]|jgi:molecular chaperone HtpG